MSDMDRLLADLSDACAELPGTTARVVTPDGAEHPVPACLDLLDGNHDSPCPRCHSRECCQHCVRVVESERCIVMPAAAPAGGAA